MKHGAAHRCLKRKIALVDDIAQCDRSQKAVDLAAERRPQIMGQAFCAMRAALDGVAHAACDLQGFIDRHHDFGNADVLGIATQPIPAARTP